MWYLQLGQWRGIGPVCPLQTTLCWQSQRAGLGPAGYATHALGHVSMRPLLHDDAPMPPQLCVKTCGIFHFYFCLG
jgi:hypothetical protein